MITKIWLQEYGPFRDASFGLAPLTVLVGPNASGKTMAVNALHHVEERLSSAPISSFRIEKAYLHPSSLQRVSDEELFQSSKRASAQGQALVCFEIDSSQRYFFSRHSEANPPLANAKLLTPGVLPLIKSLKFEPNILRQASYLDAQELTIQENGYGLATVLADMKLQDDERLSWIQEQVRRVVPNFGKVRFKRAQVRHLNESIAGQELVFDMKNASSLPPGQVSDGTILVLGMITSIIGAKKDQSRDHGSLVLIDELERALHPRALDEFVGCLRRMTQELGVQILATSHSPYLLDSLKAEEVRLTGFLDDGTATICELSDHPEFERWKDVMTPGEFWSTAGEGWIRDVQR